MDGEQWQCVQCQTINTIPAKFRGLSKCTKCHSPRIATTNVFGRNWACPARTIVNVGGSRSSKSHSIMQLLITKMTSEHGKKILILRKTFPALRMTTMVPFLDLLKAYGIYNEEGHNKTYNTYQHGDNMIQFAGLDETDKIKSAEANYIWMEEANEFDWNDYINLSLRLSGPCSEGELNHIYLSLNPDDAHGWIPMRLCTKENTTRGDVAVIHSTYVDNDFLDDAYKKALTDLIYVDENAYNVYALGKWGKVEGRIYTNYKVIPEMPVLDGARWCYGLDFGLNNPSAIVKVSYHNNTLYWQELCYKTNMTVSDIIEFFSHQERGDIFADPSAKMSIEEIFRAGYFCYPAHRDVKEGIDRCKTYPILIPSESVNLIKEIRSYSWRRDPLAPDTFLAEPVKRDDHANDAARYATYGLTEKYRLTPQPAGGTSRTFHTLTFGQQGFDRRLAGIR